MGYFYWDKTMAERSFKCSFSSHFSGSNFVFSKFEGGKSTSEARRFPELSGDLRGKIKMKVYF